MIRTVAAAGALVLVAAAPSVAAKGGAQEGMSCTVSAPISAAELNAGATWSFEVFNAEPGTSYLAKVNWPGDPSNGGHYNAGIVTDATGHGVTVLERYWQTDAYLPGGWPNGFDPMDPLGSFMAVPGQFSVQVGPRTAENDRAGKANCAGEVLP